jgi:hypothetical protein
MNYGFLKSPTSALLFISHHCGVRKVRLILFDLRRLEFELFTLPSKADFKGSIWIINVGCQKAQKNIWIKYMAVSIPVAFFSV